MNSWGSDQYTMMGIPPMLQNVPPMMRHSMMHNMPLIPNGPQTMHGGPPMQNVPPLGPPAFMTPEMMASGDSRQGANGWGSQTEESRDDMRAEDMNLGDGTEDEPNQNFIGPVQPANDGQRDRERDTRDKERDSRNDKRDRERGTDRGRRRSRDRYDRNDRNERDRSARHRRERRSKWDNYSNTEKAPLLGHAPPGRQGTHQAGEGSSMSYNDNMANQMRNMSNTMDSMNMMMNQQLMPFMMNQPILITNCILLPPIPGTSMPNRREQPYGCRTIFVGGVPQYLSEELICEIFDRFGDISDVKFHRQGACYVRFERVESVEWSFYISGYRIRTHDQTDSEACTLFIDYAVNSEDHNELEMSEHREDSPPPVEPFSPAAFTALAEKIKCDAQFLDAARILGVWLERGECNKRNANTFYSLIQASNNQIRRLYSDKTSLDDEFQAVKTKYKEKFHAIVVQFEQVAKILTAAKHQRVSDHFTKQQRRNVDTWLRMTEDMENIKEEYINMFEDEDIDRSNKSVVPLEQYKELKTEKENLKHELEGYKNEAHLAKVEAERMFEKFKAHYIAQQALQNKQSTVYPPLPPPPVSQIPSAIEKPRQPPPATENTSRKKENAPVSASEAKLISMLSAFLMVHPLGASLDYLVSYLKSMLPNITQSVVNDVLTKYPDVFNRDTKGVGASIEHRWKFVAFGTLKSERCS